MVNVPLSGTNVRLLSNVPFHSNYKHTRWFDSRSQQTSYFLSKPVIHSMPESNFQRVENTHVIKVNKSVDELWSTNYVMFKNADYNNKWFYGFVEELEYVQRNTTKVHFKLDVFQTWFHDVDFKPSFIEREHCKLWNDDGTPVINTVEESLDVGTDYDTVFSQKITTHDDVKFMVVATKEPLETGDTSQAGSIIGYPQPLNYYVLPFSLNGDTVVFDIDGSQSSTVNVNAILKMLYESESAVNNIVTIYTTEFIGLTYGYSVNTGGQPVLSFTNTPNQQVSLASFSLGYGIKIETCKEFDERYQYVLTNKYDEYPSVKESKLLMYPYSYTLLNDFKGNTSVIKNEYINANDLTIMIRGSLGTSNKMSWSIKNYNQSNLDDENIINLSDEYGLIDKQPNEVPIITDMLSAYLQGNRNSMQTQISNAQRSGIANAIGSGIGIASGLFMHQFSMAGAYTSNAIQGSVDALNNVYSVMAKQRDIANVPPQIENMGGNNSYELGNRFDGLYVIQKQIKPEYVRKLETFFGMFGYRVNEVKTPNFHTRQHFNFVKTQNATVLGNVNNDVINELQRIFDNGITFWHTDDVGNYSLSNEVI